MNKSVSCDTTGPWKRVFDPCVILILKKIFYLEIRRYHMDTVCSSDLTPFVPRINKRQDVFLVPIHEGRFLLVHELPDHQSTLEVQIGLNRVDVIPNHTVVSVGLHLVETRSEPIRSPVPGRSGGLRAPPG